MTDFPTADEWDEVTYAEWADNDAASASEYKAMFWRKKKPQETTYTPSPAARVVINTIDHLTLHPTPGVSRLQVIDQALDAARQQGRWEMTAQTIDHLGYKEGVEDGIASAIPEGKVLVDRELVEKARRLLGRAILDGCPGHLQSTGLTGHHASGGCGDRAEADGLASDAYKQLRTESLEGED